MNLLDDAFSKDLKSFSELSFVTTVSSVPLINITLPVYFSACSLIIFSEG